MVKQYEIPVKHSIKTSIDTLSKMLYTLECPLVSQKPAGYYIQGQPSSRRAVFLVKSLLYENNESHPLIFDFYSLKFYFSLHP